jgi:hypothetical protein
LNLQVQSGGTLTFTTANWNVSQSVLVKANEDDGDGLNGAGVLRLSVAGGADGGHCRFRSGQRLVCGWG